MSSRNSHIRYVATLHHVREVSLLGTVNLEFWRPIVAEYGLEAASRDGCAQILVVAASGRFKGIHFSEVSFSVLVALPDRGPSEDAGFLVQAFNSRRFFAFCERTFFKTPYRYADCHCSAGTPISIRMGSRSEDNFWAQMHDQHSEENRQPLFQGDDGWNGPVFLPRQAGAVGRQKRMFVANIRGETDRFAFAAEDQLSIRPSARFPVLKMLVDSDFTAREWIIRRDAIHAKSKTYQHS